MYSLSEEQIPLFDHLLDSKGNLVGFYFHGLDSAPLLAKSRIVQARNVVNEYSDGQTFSFNLAEIDADQIENDCCQAMPAYLFSDGTGDFLVVVPDEWKMKWKELGFPLEMQASPKPMFQNSRLA